MIKDMDLRRPPQHLEGNLLFLHSNYFGVKRVWKECFLMVNGDLLCLYSNENDKRKGKIMQEIPLMKSCVFETVIDSSRKQHVFVIENDEFKMFFSCKNKLELDFWVKGCEGIKYYWKRKREAHERKHFLSNQVKKTLVLNIDKDSCEGVTIPFHLSNGSVINVKMTKDTLYEEFSKYSNEELLCNINSKICFVNNDGTVKLAKESSKIYQEFIKSYFIVEPGYKVVVMYFENDSFEEFILNEKISTKEVLDCSLIKDAIRLHGIDNAGLCFRRTSSDNFLVCANDDKPISFLYCEPESYSPNGFLYILNKEKVFGQKLNLESNICIETNTINTGHVSCPCFTTNLNTSGYFPGHNFLSKKNSSEFLMGITPGQIQTSAQRRHSLKHDNFFVNELSILESRKCFSMPHETDGTFCSNEVVSINESKRVCFVEDFNDDSQKDLYFNENNGATNNFTSLKIPSTTCETNQKTANKNSSKILNSEEHFSNVVCSPSIDCKVNTQRLEINAINDTPVSEIVMEEKENITSSESAQTLAQVSIEICSQTPSFENSAGCHNNNNIAIEIKEEAPLLIEKKFNLQTFSQCKRCESCSVSPLCVKNPQKMKVILHENSQSDYPRHSYLCLSGTHLHYTKGHWLPCDGSSISLSSENIDRKKLNFELGNGIICKWVQETRRSFQWKVVKVTENDINSKSKDLYKHDNNFLSECNPCNVSKNIADESTTADESTLTNTDTNYPLEKSIEEAFQYRQMDIKKQKYNFLEYPINSISMNNKYIYSKHRSPHHFIKSVIKEVLSICEVFDPFLDSERRIIGNDSLTPRIGWMIRKDLCTALERFLTVGFSVKSHFLKTMFSQNNPSLALWRYIWEVSVGNDIFISIIKKIEANPNCKDSDARFRAFVCQLLVQNCNQTKNKLLNVWLEKIPLMEAVIEKYFDSSSFWRHVHCDEFKISFKTLIETTTKLNDYPFQLSLDFETKNYRSVRSASFPDSYHEKNQKSYLISIE
ncbi:uncharacterized protein LOC101240982 isoform X4 [Hydra vulgaris]|uniref:Uncharacterized protein LOC101240982 isoform X3 n=1 Tax=Hydra vulgaris TaxID=6087 RepID=A0ABM4CGP5_HYDVU